MKKALISPLEPVYNYDLPPQRIGDRVAQVENVEFPVAPPLFWVDCEDDIVADEFYWNEGVFYPIPPAPSFSSPVDPNAPEHGPVVM